MLTDTEAVDQAQSLYPTHTGERRQLDQVRRYWKGRQRLPAVIPSNAPREVRLMAKIGRVNICDIVINSLAQATFVDGFRTSNSDDDLEVWQAWQANKMDARQTGIHRAAFAYGASYAIVLPGDPMPVIRGVSPRNLTAMYGDDPDWPVVALERRRVGEWRLYDDEAVYTLRNKDNASAGMLEFVSASAHELGVCPVVRYLDADDLDDDDDVRPDRNLIWEEDVPSRGQIAPLMSLQDQIDITTFGLLTTQWYQQFKQLVILGWTPPDDKAALALGAHQALTFEDDPDQIKVSQLEQAGLADIIASREASLRHAATLSQTPVHELTGQLANLAADSIRAAEAGRDLKVGERQTLIGESHEQMLWLAGVAMGVEVPDDAQVVWRDTSIQTFAAMVDGLGKLTQMLGIPAEELWERVPGATQQDVERWKAAAAKGDAFANLTAMLNQQAAPPPAPGIPPPPAPAPPVA